MLIHKRTLINMNSSINKIKEELNGNPNKFNKSKFDSVKYIDILKSVKPLIVKHTTSIKNELKKFESEDHHLKVLEDELRLIESKKDIKNLEKVGKTVFNFEKKFKELVLVYHKLDKEIDNFFKSSNEDDLKKAENIFLIFVDITNLYHEISEISKGFGTKLKRYEEHLIKKIKWFNKEEHEVAEIISTIKSWM
jgi:acetate kinase